MSTLYIRPPSKAAADASAHWIALPCAWALADAAKLVREGLTPLAELAEAIARAERVVVLVAASDVTLLRVQVPPLSGARLRAALPNLLEDQLMTDAADALFVPGPSQDGLRTIAVAQRGWIEILLRTLQAYGARKLQALPAQLCLPFEAGVTSAAVQMMLDADTGAAAADAELALRSGDAQGVGIAIALDSMHDSMHDSMQDSAHDSAQSVASQIVQTIVALVPLAPITLYVASAQVRAFQEAAAGAMGLNQRITVLADQWSRWISGAATNPYNLFSVLDGGSGQQFAWRPWRWPLALVFTALLVNLIGVQAEWWRLRQEAEGLRAQMLQTYRASFPRENVIVDPLAQMKQKFAAAQRDSGQPADDDFGVLTANFAAAWEAAASGRPAASQIARLDYRDRALLLVPRSGSELPLDALRTALAVRGLSIQPAPPAASGNPNPANSLLIRSQK